MKDAIRAKALDLGFAEIRFAAAEAPARWGEDLADYVADGRHGDMAWMEETVERRSAPRALWPEARSIIVLGTNYAPKGDPLAVTRLPDRGNISIYARNRDYHDTVKKRLKALGRWMAETWGCDLKVFVDTAPVMEKPLAEAAGLGWRGRHTNLVSRRWGSWLFLSEIFTTLEIEPDRPEPDHCGSCHACVDACPTGALDGAGHIEPRRCISYLTIETKSEIPAELRPMMGNRIYGCDDCLAACPWNKFATPAVEPDFLPRVELTAPRLADLAQLDEAGFREVFAASPVKRAGRDRFVANVLIAVGNSGRKDLIAVAQALRDDSSPLVRAMADWAVSALGR
ncbi:tRNA epoxyqueuosine(34) reductase QueG [Paramagnetospirillum kuznetsovii]|uniref:tRNA epoxyqueuosine(34) reductase QueG n=1 Tax=Paramagnetospirillum kuznetsovii TaxID=2053833 RepID=A0A364P1Y8_9PROT|nr:tRNA epoxyqueuosine(34) reductase QueG [Paramagnetospirillum kuznetsovii]RAU23352.1 tRNA epoxyqueuosine(34) reductase QueG [Paramagnetospirillum kuznetsovii]